MTDIKISQLSNVASMHFEDLFEISRYTAPGWESRSINYHDLLHSIVGARSITVDPDRPAGSGSTTIEEGVAEAVALNPAPSASAPVVVSVRPGVYTEAPITVPSYVSIAGADGPKTVIVNASDPDNIMFTMSLNSTLSNMRLSGASGTSGVGVKSVAMTFDALVHDVVVRDCYTGFYASGSGAVIRMFHCSVVPFTSASDTALKADDGAIISATTTTIRIASSGTLTNGLYATGIGTKVTLPTFGVSDVTNGIYCDNGAIVNADSGQIDNCTNAIRIGSTGSDSKVVALGTSISDSTAYDVLMESVSGEVDFTGRMDYDKRSIVSGGIFNSYGIDHENDRLKGTGLFGIEGATEIGVPGQKVLGLGIHLNVGEGDAYNQDPFGNEIVEYWQYDASAPSSTRFTRYANNAGTQLTNLGDALVVGSKYPFAAVSLNVNVAANLGSNTIVTEHWNGSSWTEDTVCAYEKTNFVHRGDALFQNVETQRVEVGRPINDDWNEDDDILDQVPEWDIGTDMYPIRFRNNVGALTTGMQFTGGQVKGDDFDVTESGKVVSWGRNRGTETNLINILEMAADAINPTSSTTVQVSANINQDFPSEYTDSRLCSMGFSMALPAWIDTSTPLVMTTGIFASNAAFGNYNFNIRLVNVEGGSLLTGILPETVFSSINATVGVPNLLLGFIQSIDISSYSPGDSFVMALERDATGSNPLDTYAGDIVLTGVTIELTRKIIG